jgi:hypothetical protein
MIRGMGSEYDRVWVFNDVPGLPDVLKTIDLFTYTVPLGTVVKQRAYTRSMTSLMEKIRKLFGSGKKA